MASDIQTHPAVILAGVVVAVVLVILAGGKKVVVLLAPAWEWWQAREERKVQRQVRIEAGARILNDERVKILLERIDGLTAEIQEQRRELTAQRDAERERADRYEADLRGVRSELASLKNLLGEREV